LVRTITTGGPLVLDIAFAPQDELLAAGCDDGKIRVWNAETGELLKVLAVDRSDRCNHVDFSPDGRLLAGIYRRQTGESDAGGVQEELRPWDLARDEVARTLTDGENAKFVSSDFSPDGRTLAVGLVRRKEANQTTSIRLWSIAENRWDPTLVDLDGTLFWLAFSPDGKTLAVGGIRSVAGRVPIEVSQLGVWNSTTGKTIWRSETVHFEAKEPAFSSDGARVATRGNAALTSEPACASFQAARRRAVGGEE
jgi:WD40 repeat protein